MDDEFLRGVAFVVATLLGLASHARWKLVFPAILIVFWLLLAK